MKIPKPLTNFSDTLDIDDAVYEEVDSTLPMEVPQQQVAVANQSIDEREDYNTARSTYSDLIKTGQEALEGILATAQNDESARSFEAVAKMIDSVTNLTEKMYALHRKVAETTGNQLQPQTFNVDKAVFYGTAADLLDNIEDSKTK